MSEFFKQITSLDFWMGLMDGFKSLGPLAPILLAALESMIPPLPLVAIVALNVAAYGAVWGFLYSWIGTCLGCFIVFTFFRLVLKKPFIKMGDKHPSIGKARNWVKSVNGVTLFLVALFPFTPSAFLNFAFGISEFKPKKYFSILFSAKVIMIALLALAGKSFVDAFKKPWLLAITIVVLVASFIGSRKITDKKMDEVTDLTKDDLKATVKAGISDKKEEIHEKKEEKIEEFKERRGKRKKKHQGKKRERKKNRKLKKESKLKQKKMEDQENNHKLKNHNRNKKMRRVRKNTTTK